MTPVPSDAELKIPSRTSDSSKTPELPFPCEGFLPHLDFGRLLEQPSERMSGGAEIRRPSDLCVALNDSTRSVTMALQEGRSKTSEQ